MGKPSLANTDWQRAFTASKTCNWNTPEPPGNWRVKIAFCEWQTRNYAEDDVHRSHQTFLLFMGKTVSRKTYRTDTCSGQNATFLRPGHTKNASAFAFLFAFPKTGRVASALHHCNALGVATTKEFTSAMQWVDALGVAGPLVRH